MLKNLNNIWWLFLLLHGASCMHQSQNEQTTDVQEHTQLITLTKEQLLAINGKIGFAEEKMFYHTIITQGKIDVNPSAKVHISYPLPMKIAKLLVQNGQFVQKNQPLFIIEGDQILKIQQDFIDLYYRYLIAQNEYEAKKQMSEILSSQKELKQLELQYKNLEAQFSLAKAFLSQCFISAEKLFDNNITEQVIIRAPMNGQIVFENIHTGSTIEAYKTIATVYHVRDVIIVMQVFEKDAQNIHLLDTITFYSLNKKDVTYNAVITQILPLVVNELHSIEVYAKPIDAKSAKLFINTFVQVEIKNKKRKSLALPSSAIHWDGRQAYVLELIHEEQDKYIFRKRNINTGEQIDNFYEIKDTLAHAVLIEGGSILE